MTDEEMIKQYKEFFAVHTKLIDLLLERSRQDDRIIDGFSRLCTLYKDAHNGVCSDWDEQNREYEAILKTYRDITARYPEILCAGHSQNRRTVAPILTAAPYRNTLLKSYKIYTGAHRCAPCRSPCLLPSPSSPPAPPHHPHPGYRSVTDEPIPLGAQGFEATLK